VKFVLTQELGRLARWLRILGYDTSFYRQDNLSTLVITALREERVILTRNSRMTRFPGPRIVKIESDFVGQQIKQVIVKLRLKPQPKEMFTRCVICNIELENITQRIKMIIEDLGLRFYDMNFNPDLGPFNMSVVGVIMLIYLKRKKWL